MGSDASCSATSSWLKYSLTDEGYRSGSSDWCQVVHEHPVDVDVAVHQLWPAGSCPLTPDENYVRILWQRRVVGCCHVI